MVKGVPSVSFVGYGRAGKDTAAEWFRDNTNMRHTGSISDTCKPLVALALGQGIDECFAERHRFRVFWKDFLDRFRRGQAHEIVRALDKPVPAEIERTFVLQAIRSDPGLVTRNDPAKMVRLHRELADIIPGIRGGPELQEAKAEGLLDLVVWVDNPRVPKDITVDFGPEDAHLIISNEGSLGQFYDRLAKLADCLRAVTRRDRSRDLPSLPKGF